MRGIIKTRRVQLKWSVLKMIINWLAIVALIKELILVTRGENVVLRGKRIHYSKVSNSILGSRSLHIFNVVA